MLTQLKRHAIAQLSLTIFLTISLLMTIYYFFYSQILYRDFAVKTTSLSEIYSQNINNYFKQLDKNIATYVNFFDIHAAESNDPASLRTHLSDVMSNVMRYRYSNAIYNIAIILNTGEPITYNQYFNIETLKSTGILDTLSTQPACVFFKPGTAFLEDTTRDFILYGKTIYDPDGSPSFHIIEAIDTGKFVQKICEDTYFTKNNSVYILFENSCLTVTENNATKLDPARLSKNAHMTPKRNIKTVSMHNSAYNIDVLTAFSANANTNITRLLKIVFLVLCIGSGILGLLFSKKIVEHIIHPLEKTYIKINKNVFR